MRKKIMLLGKSLITFCLLWPIPVGFIIYFLIYKPLCTFFNWMVENGNVNIDTLNFMGAIINQLGDMPLWGMSHGYWWPLLYVMVVGLTICLLSRYISKGTDNRNQSINNAPLRVLVPFIFTGLSAIIAFWIVIFIVVGLYRLFLTDLIEYSVPILFCAILLAALIWFGIAYKKNWDKDKK